MMIDSVCRTLTFSPLSSGLAFPPKIGKRPSVRQLAVLPVLAAGLWLHGCAAPDRADDTAADTAAATATAEADRREREDSRTADRVDPGQADREAQVRRVEERYVIGHISSREFGYRIEWQNPFVGIDPHLIEVADDAIFVLDRENFLTRIERENGREVWRLPVAEPVMEILAITYLPDRERVYLTVGGEILVFDAGNGLQIGRQRLERIAGTPPVPAGNFFLYGSRNGQLVWHSHTVGYQWRSYQVAGAITAMPSIAGNYVAVAGSDGTISVHDLRSTNRLWTKQVLGPVVTRPAIGASTIFVSGTDQHLWAYDLVTGRNVWRYLSQSRLTAPPIFVREQLYQQIPDRGLVRFEPRTDRPDGRIIWTSPDVRGTVLAHRGERLLVWDRENRVMDVVDPQRGGKITTASLSQVHRIIATDPEGSEIYALSRDGRLVKLLPLHGGQARR